MNNLTPVLLMLAMINKNGFNNIKNAIEAADGFNSKINNMANMFSILPSLGSMFNASNTQTQSAQAYIDTLKNISDILSK